MAEGWARALKGNIIEPYSAGVEARGLDPRAVRVMLEAGVDISGHRSKHVGELAGIDFDLVVTVCDNAHESCPVFPGKTRVVHRGFDEAAASCTRGTDRRRSSCALPAGSGRDQGVRRKAPRGIRAVRGGVMRYTFFEIH